VSAPQSWRRFSLLVRPSDVEPASALLAAATGSLAVVEEPGDGGSQDGASVRVSAFVHTPAATAAAAAVRERFAHSQREGLLRGARLSAAVTVRDEDWAESWKRFYRPFAIVPGLWVAPSWEPDFHAPRGGTTLWMDPGMAFGTGLHPTTVLALRLLLPLVAPHRPMIDVGCGSGILGIAAGLAGARVSACDVDPIAVAAARANFRANGLKPASVRRVRGVPALFGRAPLVAANITADVLVDIAASLAAHVAKSGTLVTSGVTKRGRRGVLDAFAAEGLRLKCERRSGEWFAFAHRKR
jgi:ribosomal protein L11 methyltransferase